MPPPPSGQSTAQPANDSEPEEDLVDRLRVAAIGGKSTRNMARAKMAFDTSIDFERRARLLAGIAAGEPSARTKKNWRKTFGWLPIPLGILAVVGLGSMLASRTAASGKNTSREKADTKLEKNKTTTLRNGRFESANARSKHGAEEEQVSASSKDSK